ncbi:MAG: outer membrane beta-barrel protein [Verrucomicrobiota bacterium]|nr:outer membrane beta-barrel protein [Verrucomicrobiota bacterium]
MKKLTLTLCALAALGSAAFAGTETYSSRDTKTMQAPCPTWYADNEWNAGISGVYAPTNEEYRNDRYLGVDHAWGGAVDVKYFFRRYFGVGVQGFGLAINTDNLNNFGDNDNTNDFAGGALGTFTFRYPIPCTRYAPYAWAGVGAIFGGGGTNFVNNGNGGFFFDRRGESDSRLMGQYGVGFEVRFTPHIGLTNDVSYNQLDGARNDFWQFRSGVNFAF